MSIFDKILVPRHKRSTFDLSHEKKLSMKMGYLYPTFIEEVLPGDRFKVNSTIMMRLAPLLAPVMHRVNVYTHYFFVPNRIIWENFGKFITGGEDGKDNTAWSSITINDSTKQRFYKGSLADYLGVPYVVPGNTVNGTQRISRLPFMAYQAIYNEYYRDQNLIPPVDFTNSDEVTTLRKRAWEKDYFTAALPFAQKGDPVGVPTKPAGQAIFTRDDGNDFTDQSAKDVQMLGLGNAKEHGAYNINEGALRVDPKLQIDINDLRTATRLQRWLERNARAGSRYVEHVLAHWGVRSKDARQNRPEYLAGGRQAVTLSEVLNHTGPTIDTQTGNPAQNTTEPGGSMYGHGISVGNTNRFSRGFSEHGFVMGITSVLPRTAYQQGLHKMWRRQTKFDYFQTEFAHLGEQEVQQRELLMDWEKDDAANDALFGYVPKYSEYKFKMSTTHADFKDDLAFWHMTRKFDPNSPPALNKQFVEADPTDRIFAVNKDADGNELDNLWCQIHHNFKASRIMPYYGTPSAV